MSEVEHEMTVAVQFGDQDENDLYNWIEVPECFIEMGYYQVLDQLGRSANPFRKYMLQAKDIDDAGLDPIYLMSQDCKRIIVTSVERMDKELH